MFADFSAAQTNINATKITENPLLYGMLALSILLAAPVYCNANPDTVNQVPKYTFDSGPVLQADTAQTKTKAPKYIFMGPRADTLSKAGYTFITPQSLAATNHIEVNRNDFKNAGLYTIILDDQFYHTAFPPSLSTSGEFSFVDFFGPQQNLKTASLSELQSIEFRPNQWKQLTAWGGFSILPVFTPMIMNLGDNDEFLEYLFIGGLMYFPVLLLEAVLFDSRATLLFKESDFFKGSGNWQNRFTIFASSYPAELIARPWMDYGSTGKSIPSLGLAYDIHGRTTTTTAHIRLEYAMDTPRIDYHYRDHRPPAQNPIILSTGLSSPFIQQDDFNLDLELGVFASQWNAFGEYARINWMLNTSMNIPVGMSHGYYFDYSNASVIHSLNIGLSGMPDQKQISSRIRKVSVIGGVQYPYLRGYNIHDRFAVFNIGMETTLAQNSGLSMSFGRGTEQVYVNDERTTTVRPELFNLKFAYRLFQENLDVKIGLGTVMELSDIKRVDTYELSDGTIRSSTHTDTYFDIEFPLTCELVWTAPKYLTIAGGIGWDVLGNFWLEDVNDQPLNLLYPSLSLGINI